MLALCATIFSCQRIEDIENRLDVLEAKVATIDEAVNALQAAYDAGKLITEVTPVDGGFKIVFSDNSFIDVLHGTNGINGTNGTDGADGITPFVSMDSNGFWTVSYDGGATFTKLLNADGQQVSGLGIDGKDGVDGVNGTDGQNGVSVKVEVNAEGYYTFVLYDSGAPETILETIVTPYTSDSSKIISSISKNQTTNEITITMANGDTFTFNKKVVLPASIAVLNSRANMIADGCTFTMEFRVNPSNADFNYNIGSKNCEIALDFLARTRSYVTAPTNYSLTKVEPVYNTDGSLKKGQYRAYVKDLGKSSDYEEMVALVVTTKDELGAEVEISSSAFEISYTENVAEFSHFSINDVNATSLTSDYIDVRLPYGTDVTRLKPLFVSNGCEVYVNGVLQTSGESEVNFSSPVIYTIKSPEGYSCTYTVSISYSGIPVVYVNTKDAAPIVSKDDWLGETVITITNAGQHNVTFTDSEIRGRGNSTWLEPKKPYAIKLGKKDKVLGMPKHKRWVLLANYFDKTCLRNAVAFEIARRSPAISWTPRGYHVDLVVNGQFLGTYFLCEQIKIDENRVNVGDGYLLEFDTHYDEVNKFRSPIRDMPVMVKEPDEEDLTPEYFEQIKQNVTNIENALYGDGSTTEGYLQYLDLDSYIDYWLVYDLTSTGEPTHPKSVYMHVTEDGIMHAGPVWDFDYFTFHTYYNTSLINTHSVWNDRIIHDPNNQARIREKWNNQREAYQDIENYIREQWELVKESAAYNSTIWEPLTRYPNYDQNYSVQKSVDKMLEFWRAHFTYMDSIYGNQQ